ncbi:MAG: photosynthetic complex assembly protein PuhC [Pseudomonadota bacterium]
MSDHSHDIHVPKPALISIALMLATITVFVGVARLTGVGIADLPKEATIERLQVRFADEPTGGVGAYDPESGEAIHMFDPGAGGFVRTSLRSLSLNRRRAGIGPTPAYELQRSNTGNVILFDPETGKSITLDAFGDLNENDFAQLFDAQAPTP